MDSDICIRKSFIMEGKSRSDPQTGKKFTGLYKKLRSIIRAVADIIADKARDIASYHIHQFRKNDAPTSTQLIRTGDNARAWRLMIQKKGAGWRLNYWQIPTSEGIVIELANIGKESEREIY